VRLFAAIDLSPETQDAMAAEQKRIAASLGASAAPLKWVRPDHAHLTLVFLGEVDAAAVPLLVDTFGLDVAVPPFDIVFSGIGVFPARGAPRVLWIGIGAGGSPLSTVQIALTARVSARGIPIEARDFHPHLTLARWTRSRPSDRHRALAAGRPGAVARQRVEWATLYESRLSSSGATYVPLTRANLTRT
jgi:RNA 2',3'-cyclic 3'-phosphodiesterase